MRALLKGAVLLGAGILFLTGGCSSQAPKGLDAAGYAEGIKQDIHDYVASVRGNPKLVREQGAILLEKLEVYETQPVGDHGAIYAQMVEKVRALAKQPRGAGEVNQALSELQKLANQLPGTVKPRPVDSD
jgi:hypothetical protein